MSRLSRSGRFHQSSVVTIEVRDWAGNRVNVEVAVWRSVADPSVLYISTRLEGGSWRTEQAPLDMSRLSRSGRFHQSNVITVDIPITEPEAPTEPDIGDDDMGDSDAEEDPVDPGDQDIGDDDMGDSDAPPVESRLTITAFCTKSPSENLVQAMCASRSSSLDLGRRWDVWAHSVSDWDNVLYRFNRGGNSYHTSDVETALQALGVGCHELQVYEENFSTHWSLPYDFCIDRVTPTWAQMGSLEDRVLEDWNPTVDAIDVLTDSWNSIIINDTSPSRRLANIARQERDLAQSMVDRLIALRPDPSTRNATMSRYLESAISYWSSDVSYATDLERYALARVTWGSVLWKRFYVKEVYVEYRREKCSVWRLLYTNPEVACDEVAGAERDAAAAKAEARAWSPPQVAPPTPAPTPRPTPPPTITPRYSMGDVWTIVINYACPGTSLTWFDALYRRTANFLMVYGE